MALQTAKRKPTFVWQAVLIVLPVAVLAAVGFVSLRQDRILAQHDAEEKALALAEELAPKLWLLLTRSAAPSVFPTNAFQVDADRNLVSPPACEPAPVPPLLAITNLNADQARLWIAARQSEIEEQNLSAAEGACRAFLESRPPADFAAIARFTLGLVLSRQDRPDAAEQFERVIADYPNASGESGLPLAHLAALKRFEQAARQRPAPAAETASAGALCRDWVEHPSPVTPLLLRRLARMVQAPEARAQVERWTQLWREHQWSRELFLAAGEALRSEKRVFGFRTPAGRQSVVTSEEKPPATGPAPVFVPQELWIAFRGGDDPVRPWFFCMTESDAGTALAACLRQHPRIPDYFGIGIELDSLRLWQETDSFVRGGRAVRPREMAASMLASASAPGAPLKVNVYLTSPSTLFKRERARTSWFGLLIGSSALAACVGLWAAFRAFQRQLRLSELKSNFVSSVSHELRAPIASVRLMAESLERGKVDQPSKQQEYFRFIVQECRRLSSLIENVLDFSRIEQGRKEYEFEPTDLPELVRQTVKLMETYAADRQVALVLNARIETLPPPDEQPLVDGKALQQALINLIDNALKHSPHGATVTVGFEFTPASRQDVSGGAGHGSPAPPGGSVLRLWVEDQGPGIPQNEQEKIFERFYRRGSELRRETQGVGIGLSIVKHIVEAHGGRVIVRSDPGQGSRFTIELPRVNHGTDSHH